MGNPILIVLICMGKSIRIQIRGLMEGCISIFQDVFLFDSCEQIFVWIGKNASPAEKRNGMTYAHVSSNILYIDHQRFCSKIRERSGSMVECLTRDQGAAVSSLTGSTAL